MTHPDATAALDGAIRNLLASGDLDLPERCTCGEAMHWCPAESDPTVGLDQPAGFECRACGAFRKIEEPTDAK